MYRQLTALLVGVFLLSQLSLAQVTTGTISGAVRDTTAAIVPGVAVSIKNLETGIARSVKTDEQGRYRALNLPVGKYEVQVQLEGFQTSVQTGIDLMVAQEAVVNFTLSVGQVTDSVEVVAEVPLVEATNATITGLVDDKTIRELPLNGRSFAELVLLQVGTNFARRDQTTNVLGGNGAKISISGARPQQNSFLLDGTDVNDARNQTPGGVTGLSLGVDTVREFRVLTNSYSAEYGRSAGGVITAITLSGTNHLHGSAFEFLRNSALDARNFFDLGAPPPFKRNQFGFTLGGPIKKDRTFFFGSYEGLRDRLGHTGIATVPDALAHQGILPQQGVVGAPLVNVVIPPAVVPWLNLYPLPNGRNFGNGTAEYIWTSPQPSNENYFMARIDHKLSENHSLFGRYTFDGSNQTAPRAFPFDIIMNTVRNQYLTVEVDSVFSAATLNSFRFGLNRSYPSTQEQNSAVPPGLTFVPGTTFTNGGYLSPTGLSVIGYNLAPTSMPYTLFEWSDDVTRAQGRHTLKTGFIIKRVRTDPRAQQDEAGFYSIPGGVSDLLQGRAGTFTIQWPGLNMNRDWRQNFFGIYAQDDFKAASNLTFNIGVREEFLTSPMEINGKCSNVTEVLQTSPKLGCPVFDTFKNNWMPRVGFAWNTLNNQKLVLRGGFGFFYDQPFPNYWEVGVRGIPPYEVTYALVNPPFPNGISLIDLSSPPSSKGTALRSQKYTGTTYAMQYNFNIQSQILESTGLTISYMGSQGRHLFRTAQMNTRVPQILPDGTKYFAPNAPFINPLWGNLTIQQTDANSNYNALALAVDRRFRGGLRVHGSYTFSKIMSEAESVFGADFTSSGNTSQDFATLDPYNLGRERAPAAFDLRHQLIVNYTYDLPLKSKGAVGKLVEGWEIDGITTVTSGTPFSVIAQCCSNNGSTGQYVYERPNLVPGQSNNPVLGGPDRYFNLSSFTPSQPGFYGNLGRNTLIGPGLFMFNFSLVKHTAITEKTNLEFRTEFFNLFNRANFALPNNTIFDSRGNLIPAGGRITNTSTSARQIQFALKLLF